MLKKISLQIALLLIVFAAVLYPAGLFKGLNTVSFGNLPGFDNNFGYGTLTGNVTFSSPAVTSAKVIVENTSLSAITDSAGHFEIKHVPVKIYLTVFAVGNNYGTTHPDFNPNGGYPLIDISGGAAAVMGVYIPKPGDTVVVNNMDAL